LKQAEFKSEVKEHDRVSSDNVDCRINGEFCAILASLHIGVSA